MKRRRVLSAAGLSATALLAGCTGGSGLTVADAEARGTAFGNVKIDAQVRNNSDSEQSGTLVGEVDVEGGDTYTERQSITVAGDDTSIYELSVDLPFSDSLSSDQFLWETYIE